MSTWFLSSHGLQVAVAGEAWQQGPAIEARLGIFLSLASFFQKFNSYLTSVLTPK